MSPVPNANCAPLAAICWSRLAWSGLVPSALVKPQSPNTANLKVVPLPGAGGVGNTGDGSLPSRSGPGEVGLPENRR